MKALIVYNPFSGKQRFSNKIEYLKIQLVKKYEKVDIFRSVSSKSITSYVSENGRKYGLIVASGGDGTLNELINGLMEIDEVYRPTIAYVPSGTVNDVGHMLKLKKNIKKTCKIILKNDVVKMDITKVMDRYFIYAAAAGQFTNVSYDVSSSLKKRFGRMAYFMACIKYLTKEEQINMQVETEEEKFSGTYYVVMALNSKRIAGFSLFRKTPPKLDDGLIDVTFLDTNQFHLSFINLGGFFAFGDIWQSGIKTIQCSKIRLITENEVSYNLDGEFAGKEKDITMEVIQEQYLLLLIQKLKRNILLLINILMRYKNGYIFDS